MFAVFLLTGTIAFVLLLMAGGWDKVTLLTRVFYAGLSGAANGLLWGTIAPLILSLIMSWQTWRVRTQNKKKLARKTLKRDQNREKTTQS